MHKYSLPISLIMMLAILIMGTPIIWEHWAWVSITAWGIWIAAAGIFVNLTIQDRRAS